MPPVTARPPLAVPVSRVFGTLAAPSASFRALPPGVAGSINPNLAPFLPYYLGSLFVLLFCFENPGRSDEMGLRVELPLDTVLAQFFL